MTFRRLFLLTFAVSLAASGLAAAHEGHEGHEPVVLFDGTAESLEANWRGYQRESIGDVWTIDVDGSLHFPGKREGVPHLDLITKESYGDFDLSFEWRLARGSNSGVIYRSKLGEKAPYITGAEYQILDNDVHEDGKIPSHRAGSIYDLVVPTGEPNVVGAWNVGRVVMQDGLITHYLNGTAVAQLEVGSDEWDAKMAESKFSKGRWEGKFMAVDEGGISLQDHGDPVWFRNIIIKSLD